MNLLVPAFALALALPSLTARISAQGPAEIRSAATEQTPAALSLYRELLRLPNDAHAPADILQLVAWLETAFRERGFQTRTLPTAGSPLLLAAHDRPGADRTVLVYLQADGQPVDPSRWEQEDPYEPVLKRRTDDGTWEAIPWESLQRDPDPEWRIFARSASDSKGPIAQFLSAWDAMRRIGRSPDFNLKVIVDTEEEMGSPNLPPAVRRDRELLAADMLVIFDGPPHVSGEPTLKFGARGIATFTLTTYGPRVPQHSGHYGNYVPNPALGLAEILASMKDASGRVTIPGFYDGVTLDDQLKAQLERVPDDEENLWKALGIAATDAVGENLQEAVQYPSINIRGLSAGWIGDQVRTIIPATATAEVDVRLVVESDPDRLHKLIREHISSLGYHLTDGEPTDRERSEHPRIASMSWNLSYRAFRTDFDSEPGVWLTRAMVRLHGTEPIRIRTSGGSIPIAPFVQTLGVPAVGVPTVNPDNNQHSPNENLRLHDFIEGIAVILAILLEDLD